MRWLTRHIPTRETIHEHRLLRPFAPHLTKEIVDRARQAKGENYEL